MPFRNDRLHHRRAWSVVLLVAPFVVATAAGAMESVPRACDEMSFKVIAQLMDAASNFETRLVLLGKYQAPGNRRRSLQDS
jgi:hypothetical protein